MGFFNFDGTIIGGILNTPHPIGRLYDDNGTLQVVSETAGGRASFVQVDGLGEVSASNGLGNLAQGLEFGGETLRFWDTDLEFLTGPSGTNAATLFSDGTGAYVDSFQAMSFMMNGKTILIVGDQSGNGLGVYEANQSGGFDQAAFYGNGTNSILEDISGLAHTKIGNTNFVVITSASSDSITAFRIDSSGHLHPMSSIGSDQYLPISNPQDIEIVTVNGTAFAVVASAGTSSLTVLELSQTGILTPVDQVVDDLNMRFAGANQLEAFSHQGRAYVVTCGQDDGISLWTVLPNGRLVHLETIADEVDMPIANVTDLQVIISADTVRLFALGGSETGIAQFTLDLGVQGMSQIISGSGVYATHQIDVLIAGDGGDTIEARNDADILVDGTGQDTLSGGWGYDLFVMTADGGADTITDFQPGVDRLDLSAWSFLHSADQLTINSTNTGAILQFQNETLTVHSKHGTPLSDVHFFDANTLNASHVDVSWTQAALTGDDIDIGDGSSGPGNGGSGDNTTDPDEGTATFDAQTASDFVPTVSIRMTAMPQSTGPPPTDPAITLYGNDGDNILIGAGLDNILSGGAGNDSLSGLDGNDQIFGGLGDDLGLGGAGNDVAEMGSGDDRVHAGSGDDAVHGHAGFDTLLGQDGGDTLFGGAGDDVLVGGTGQDHLAGGAGKDIFVFNGFQDGTIDTIEDFEIGEDLLALRGVDGRFDALDIHTVMIGGEEMTEIAYDGHIIQLGDTDAGSLDETDFWFL